MPFLSLTPWIAAQTRRAGWWESTAQDVGYVLRSLRRSPGFTATAVVTLALGIGANGAIFSVLDRLALRAPPGVARAGEVWRLRQRFVPPTVTRPVNRFDFSPREFRAVRAAAPDSAAIMGFLFDRTLVGPTDALLTGIRSYVSDDYFRVLGVRPAVGRFFEPGETELGTPTAVAVISHARWIAQYGGDASVLGKTIEVDSRSHTIVGVVPANFVGTELDAVDVWVPMNTLTAVGFDSLPWHSSARSMVRIHVIGRALSPDMMAVTEAKAAIAIRTLAGNSPQVSAAAVSLVPLRHAAMRDDQQMATSTRLAGVAAIILLIATANVANLQLVRGIRRRREIAVRLALGISRRRLVRQLLTESVVIASLGAVIAFVAALWGSKLLRHGLLPDIAWGDRAVDPRLVLFTAAIAMLAGIGSGLLPALAASRPDLTSSLREGEREGTFRRSRLRSALLVAQVALSLVLVAGAGLFVQSLRNVEAVDIGFDADRLLGAMAWPKMGFGNRSAELTDRVRTLASDLRLVPGVERVGVASSLPMISEMMGVKLFRPNGDSVLLQADGPRALKHTVGPDYFVATGMRIQSGRALMPTDRMGAERVVVVNATMAKTIWPGTTAIGQCVIIDKRDAPCLRVVGVVADGHWRAIVEGPAMQLYLPLEQHSTRFAALMIRTAPGRAAEVSTQVRAVMASTFGDWAEVRVTTMAERLAPELRPWRVSAMMYSAAGLLALLVAAVGVYGTIAYTVTQRMHEMGVRRALGARGWEILRLVIGGGVRTVAIGIAIGAIATLALGRLVASALYGIAAHDPLVLVTGAATLLAVSIAACIVPARRATTADPVSVLRSE